MECWNGSLGQRDDDDICPDALIKSNKGKWLERKVWEDKLREGRELQEDLVREDKFLEDRDW